MTTVCHYRPATHQDLAFIVDVYNSTIASRMVTADTQPITIADRLSWFEQHQTASRPLWIIEVDAKAAGWISLSSFYGRPAYANTVEISLYLHADYRGQGIGQQSVKAMEHYARQQNISTILSFIFAHNQPSLKLFYQLGYQSWGHLPQVAELDGIKRDLQILGKQL